MITSKGNINIAEFNLFVIKPNDALYFLHILLKELY